MTLNYCSCEKKAKNKFSIGFFIAGVVFQLLVCLGGIVAGILYRNLVFAGIGCAIASLMIWDMIDYKRQALFLGHSNGCAQRYSIIAAISSFKGYYPTYGKLGGYRGIIREAMEKRFGAKTTSQLSYLFMGALITLFVGVIAWSQYDGLRLQRDGQQVYGRYGQVVDPVTDFATFSLLGILFFSIFLYILIYKRLKYKKFGFVVLMLSDLSLWLTSVYLATVYVRQDFILTGVGLTIISTVTALIICSVLYVMNWDEKVKRRRKKL